MKQSNYTQSNNNNLRGDVIRMHVHALLNSVD